MSTGVAQDWGYVGCWESGVGSPLGGGEHLRRCGKLPGNGVDVNEELGHTPDSPFCKEHEAAIPGPVPSSLAETWEEVTVPADCDGHQVTALVRFATGDDACIVQVSSGADVRAAGKARDLFAALATARRELENQGLRLACNGARQDVWPSGMPARPAMVGVPMC